MKMRSEEEIRAALEEAKIGDFPAPMGINEFDQRELQPSPPNPQPEDDIYDAVEKCLRWVLGESPGGHEKLHIRLENGHVVYYEETSEVKPP